MDKNNTSSIRSKVIGKAEELALIYDDSGDVS
jgi:hypothetical protein